MTETPLAWDATTTFFHVVCRLGQAIQDTADVGTDPDLMTQGGTVQISMSPSRVRYTSGGVTRMVTLRPHSYIIQPSTGELVNTADGTVGVSLLDSSSPGMDPAGWTYDAVVTPEDGAPWTVTFNQTGAVSGTVDLASVASMDPFAGSSTLDARVTQLEGEVDALQQGVPNITPGTADGDVLTWDASTSTWGPEAPTGGTGGVTDHGALTGLADDDHVQYHTDARGDVRYVKQTDLAVTAGASVSGSNTGDQDLSGYATTASLATVATTGAYTDLSGKPTIPDSPDDIGAAPATQPINAQTGAYTLTASDAGKLVTVTAAAGVTVTVPASTFTAGQRVDVLDLGAGRVTFVAGAGATLGGTPSLVSRAQHSAHSIIFLSSTDAVVVGDLA